MSNKCERLYIRLLIQTQTRLLVSWIPQQCGSLIWSGGKWSCWITLQPAAFILTWPGVFVMKGFVMYTWGFTSANMPALLITCKVSYCLNDSDHTLYASDNFQYWNKRQNNSCFVVVLNRIESFVTVCKMTISSQYLAFHDMRCKEKLPGSKTVWFI